MLDELISGDAGNASAAPSDASTSTATPSEPTSAPASTQDPAGTGAAPALEAPGTAAPAGTPAATPTGEPPKAEEQPVVPLTEEQQEEELKRIAADPLTPKFAREKIEQAMALAGKRKATVQEFQTQLETLKSQYEGKESLTPEDLARYKEAEEKHYKLTSLSATPDEISATLKETIAAPKLQALKTQYAWDFLERPDGTPDLDNLQVIVDRFVGEPGKVSAKDAMNAINALKEGTLEPYDLHQFATTEEFESWQRRQNEEQAAVSQRQLAENNAKYQETQTRIAALTPVVNSIQQQVEVPVQELLGKLHLMPVPNEPKIAADFKAEVWSKLANIANSAVTKNPAIADIYKALNLLKDPQGVDAPTIEAEIRSYTSSPQFTSILSKGLSELRSEFEKVAAQSAYQYKLMMMGYEQEISKGQNAREIIGKPNQSDALPNYTPEELAKMSAHDRASAVATAFSNDIRNQNRYNGAPRLGG
jgi:hypothetical protein